MRPERTRTAISRPGHAVLEVGAAQQVGDVLGLGALGVEGEHVDPAGAERAGAARGLPERRERLGVDAPVVASPETTARERRQQARSEAAGDPERDGVGGPAVAVPEVAREVEDAADLGAPEGVDRLVGVADDDEVAAVTGDRPEQPHLARVGVLVLVDEDVAEAGAQVGPHRGLLGQQHRAVDQLRVVDGGLVVEDRLGTAA